MAVNAQKKYTASNLISRAAPAAAFFISSQQLCGAPGSPH